MLWSGPSLLEEDMLFFPKSVTSPADFLPNLGRDEYFSQEKNDE